MRESDADMIIANDIGKRYQKNPQMNQVFFVDNKKVKYLDGKKRICC